MEDVSKCNILTCEKYDSCGYGTSKCESLMEFKHFCVEQDKYFSSYAEGEIFKVVEKKVEEVTLIEE